MESLEGRINAATKTAGNIRNAGPGIAGAFYPLPCKNPPAAHAKNSTSCRKTGCFMGKAFHTITNRTRVRLVIVQANVQEEFKKPLRTFCKTLERFSKTFGRHEASATCHLVVCRNLFEATMHCFFCKTDKKVPKQFADSETLPTFAPAIQRNEGRHDRLVP